MSYFFGLQLQNPLLVERFLIFIIGVKVILLQVPIGIEVPFDLLGAVYHQVRIFIFLTVILWFLGLYWNIIYQKYGCLNLNIRKCGWLNFIMFLLLFLYKSSWDLLVKIVYFTDFEAHIRFLWLSSQNIVGCHSLLLECLSSSQDFDECYLNRVEYLLSWGWAASLVWGFLPAVSFCIVLFCCGSLPRWILFVVSLVFNEIYHSKIINK